jgi:hypothetical protein
MILHFISFYHSLTSHSPLSNSLWVVIWIFMFHSCVVNENVLQFYNSAFVGIQVSSENMYNPYNELRSFQIVFYFHAKGKASGPHSYNLLLLSTSKHKAWNKHRYSENNTSSSPVITNLFQSGICPQLFMEHASHTRTFPESEADYELSRHEHKHNFDNKTLSNRTPRSNI